MEYGDFVGIGLGSCDRTVLAKVSRLWKYIGGFHHGPVKLLHVVLCDSKGNALSVLVPTDVVSTYLGLLVEGRVYTLANFFFLAAPAHSRYDWLTAIDELPPPNNTPTCLVVVVGVITGVSPILSYNVPRVIESIRKRLVTLSNCRGLNITLTLWGEAADRFDGDDVYSRGQAVMVVGVFVGTTIRVYGDSKQRTGGYSCKWYMDEDIPEINMLRSRYKCLRNFTLVVSWPPPHITPS